MKVLSFLFIIVLSFSAQASTYKYKCFSYGDSEKVTMDLSIDSQTATADILEMLWDQDIGGPLDENYKPRGNVKYLRYGHSLIVAPELVTGGKELRDGDLGGFARVEGEAEGGYYQYKFICKSK